MFENTVPDSKNNEKIKVLYVPLDERACNLEYPQILANLTDSIQLIAPQTEMMGYLKQGADVDALWQWIYDNAAECSYAILSVDTLLYGNLINSRIHQLSIEECKSRLNNFKKLKSLVPNLEIHAFNLVARVAAYNKSFEDPDYWDDFGYDIWRYTCLMDKESRDITSKSEDDEKITLENKIPTEYLDDFLQRRKVDRYVNLSCLELLAQNIFKILTIPKDDTSEFGYAAMDSIAIEKYAQELKVMHKLYVYPGADEVGSVLLARVFCISKNYIPRIYVRYSSTNGPYKVPKYEDRPLHESIKWQITSAGGIVETNPDSSNCLLAVNATGTKHIEASEQFEEIDFAFRSNININEFLNYIQFYQKTYSRAVGIAEVSCCNGCENRFMELAEATGVLRSVQAIQGWNTAQNSIGVTLAHLVIASYYSSFQADKFKWQASESFKISSILMDWRGQALAMPQYVRMQLSQNANFDPYHLKELYGPTIDWFKEDLSQWLVEFNKTWYPEYAINIDTYAFNWDSLFFQNLTVLMQEM